MSGQHIGTTVAIRPSGFIAFKITVPHFGGPTSLVSFNVLVGSLPAARVSDMAVRVGPPDSIILGFGTVLINNLPAARIGDMTVHDGVIVVRLPTVLTRG